jgi:hypothetical protein
LFNNLLIKNFYAKNSIFTHMIRYTFIILFPLFGCSQTKFELIKKTSSFKHPESVCIVNSDKILIADIGKSLKSTEVDSDGVIYQCSISSINSKNKLNKNFKLNAPKGMAINNKTLFIADLDRIVLVNIETGIKTDEIAFADKTVYLNDVFLLDENTLLATVTNQHELYAITIDSKEIINLSNNSLEGANGLCRNKNKIYVCGFSSKEKRKGSIYEYDIESNKTTQLIKEIGHLDGMKLYHEKLLVSDWGADYNHGKIWEIDLTTNQARIIFEDAGLKNPSGFDILGDTLIMPCLDSGDILVYKLK